MTEPSAPPDRDTSDASRARSVRVRPREDEPASSGPVELAASVAETAASTVLDTAGTIADAAVTAAGAAVTVAGAAANTVRDTAGAIGHTATTIAGAAASVAGAAAGAAAAAAEGATKPVVAAARPLVGRVDRATAGARREIADRSGGRSRRLRRQASGELPYLYDLYPDARNASIRDLGLRTVPVESVRGTAVGGPLRRGDFLPPLELRTGAWQARWQRIQRAIDDLVNLPPIEVYKVGDGYWVVDGHNRVAAALYNDQVALDATVQELRFEGGPTDGHPSALGAVLEGTPSLRAAGAGRLTRTSDHADAPPPRDRQEPPAADP